MPSGSPWKRWETTRAQLQPIKKAIALNDERTGTFASAHVNLSAYYNRTGDSAQALEYARKALDLDPKSDRAWFQKGRADEHRDGWTTRLMR